MSAAMRSASSTIRGTFVRIREFMRVASDLPATRAAGKANGKPEEVRDGASDMSVMRSSACSPPGDVELLGGGECILAARNPVETEPCEFQPLVSRPAARFVEQAD